MTDPTGASPDAVPDGAAHVDPDVEALRPAERRRLIQRAIRDRLEPPPGLERLALQIALRQAALRWITLLYAVGFIVEGTSFLLEHSNGARIRDVVLALLFAVLGRQQYRVGRRAKEAVERWDVPLPRPAAPDLEPDPDPESEEG